MIPKTVDYVAHTFAHVQGQGPLLSTSLDVSQASGRKTWFCLCPVRRSVLLCTPSRARRTSRSSKSPGHLDRRAAETPRHSHDPEEILFPFFRGMSDGRTGVSERPCRDATQVRNMLNKTINSTVSRIRYTLVAASSTSSNCNNWEKAGEKKQ